MERKALTASMSRIKMSKYFAKIRLFMTQREVTNYVKPPVNAACFLV